MESPAYQGPVDPLNQQRPQHPLANYQFSSDELRVLRECNTESFFQRSLPFGTVFGLGAYFGIKQGYLQASAKFGTIPKVAAGVIIGYFLGKFSYQQKCAEKIMRLPNSQLAEVLKQRKKGGNMYGVLSPEQGMQISPFTPGADVYTDEYANQKRSSALDLDSDNRQQSQGLDDTYRPSLDNTPQTFDTDLDIEPAKQAVTYEELRRKNREEYAKKAQSIYSRPLPQDTPVVRRSYEKPAEESNANIPPSGPKNKYGDSWAQ